MNLHTENPYLKHHFNMNKEPKQIVYIESPYSGDIELNLAYLGACTLDCIEKGEIPISSHGDLPRWLDDTDPAQRALGIKIGFERAKLCSKTVCYEDFGRSEGMKLGLEDAMINDRPVDFRMLPNFKEFFRIRKNINLLFREFVKVCGFSKEELRQRNRRRLITDTKATWVIIANEVFPDKTYIEIGGYINKDRSTCYHYLRNKDVEAIKKLCQKLKYKLGLYEKSLLSQ